MSDDIQIKNRKAFYEYEILEKFNAGLILLGTEIKSIKQGEVSIKEGSVTLRIMRFG